MQSFAQYGSYGSYCDSCGEQGPVTSLISYIPTNNLKGVIRFDDADNFVIGPICEYGEMILSKTSAGKRVLIDYCECEKCGGLIAVECIHHMVSEKCLSCNDEIHYSGNVAMPSLVPQKPLLAKIRCNQPNAQVITHIRKAISLMAQISIYELQMTLKSDSGLLIGFKSATIGRLFFDELLALGCEIDVRENPYGFENINWVNTK